MYQSRAILSIRNSRNQIEIYISVFARELADLAYLDRIAKPENPSMRSTITVDCQRFTIKCLLENQKYSVSLKERQMIFAKH
jgi:hypothetical protein